MAQYGNQPADIGDYSVIEQIGSGSFSVVWHAKHKFKGYDVAIKEIATGRLNKKLQESLLSEIEILRKIDHPNITRLHETIEATGRIYLVLEYCTGGDLSTYIHRHGRVSQATARHFMRQLAAGLRVLRENNLIHRDLKPQVEKFRMPGFARGAMESTLYLAFSFVCKMFSTSNFAPLLGKSLFLLVTKETAG